MPTSTAPGVGSSSQFDQKLGDGAGLWGFPQYEPIASARSKSGSIRTWSSSHTIGGEGIRCKTTGTNTLFVENSAGNVSGGVYGRVV